jgi:hypothetical protein
MDRKTQMKIRIYEMGIASRIAHNMAKYMVGVSDAWTVDTFLTTCRWVMTHHGLDQERINRILEDAHEQAKEEVVRYITTGAFTTDGGSEVHPEALIGYAVEELVAMV